MVKTVRSRASLLTEDVSSTHQLSRQQGHVLDNGQADPPLGVLGQFHDGRQQRLRQLADADHVIDAVQVGDDVEAHLGALRHKTHAHWSLIMKP